MLFGVWLSGLERMDEELAEKKGGWDPKKKDADFESWCSSDQVEYEESNGTEMGEIWDGGDGVVHRG